MLGKLMKHEFRATGRFGLPLCGVMLTLSVLAGVMIRYWSGAEYGWWERVGSIVIVLFFMSIFAVAIGIFIILMQHFKRNLLGDEGYLMRTLPVSMHELLLSKLFVALIWYIVSGVLIALSALIVGALAGELSLRGLGEVLDVLRQYLAEDPGILARAILGGLGGMVFLTLLFYADFTLTQSFSKHKVLYNIMGVVIMIVLLHLVFGINDLFYAASNSLGTIGSVNSGSVGVIGGADGPTAIYVATRGFPLELVEIYIFDVLLYFLTWALLKLRPNLE